MRNVFSISCEDNEVLTEDTELHIEAQFENSDELNVIIEMIMHFLSDIQVESADAGDDAAAMFRTMTSQLLVATLNNYVARREEGEMDQERADEALDGLFSLIKSLNWPELEVLEEGIEVPEE